MCVFTHLRLVKIPRPLVQKLKILHAAGSVIYFLIYMNLDHALLLTASATFDAVRPPPALLRPLSALLYCGEPRRCSCLADSAPLRPLPLHCSWFHSTATASALLRPLPLHSGCSPHDCSRSQHDCGRSPHCCGRSAHHCSRSMSESD